MVKLWRFGSDRVSLKECVELKDRVMRECTVMFGALQFGKKFSAIV